MGTEGSRESRMGIPIAKLSKARVCGSSLAGIAGSCSARGTDVCGVPVVQLDKRQKPGQLRQRNK